MKSKHGSAALTVMFLVLLISGCGGGGGGDSSPGTPVAPTGVTATAGDNSVSISWSAVAGATSYNIYWSTTSGVTKATGTKVAGVTSPNIVTGLTNGTPHYFVVTAVNAIGEGADSSQVSATPTLASPAAPTGVTANAGHGQVTISWSAVAGATSYNIYFDNTAGVTIATGNKLTGVVSPSIVPGLTNGTPYYFVVTAVNASGESPESTEVSATPTPAPPPPAPANVTANAGPGQVTISWNAVTGATSYNIYFDNTAGVTQVTGTKVSGATSPRIVTGLINGTAYYFVVTAVNADGESADSSPVVSATPTPLAAPSAPGGVSANKGAGQATISWDNVTDATSYNIYYSTTTGVSQSTGTKIAGITGSPRIVPDLIRGTTYYFVVTAVNAIGESADSSQVFAIPDAPDPTFSQADLTGIWNIVVVQSGTDNGWYHVTTSVNDSGTASVISSGGFTTPPTVPAFSITSGTGASAGVVTETGLGSNATFHGKMTTSKNLIVGTSTVPGGTTFALHIFVKRVPGVIYSPADLASKTFVWNKIVSGSGYWEKAAGAIDPAGVMSLSYAEDSSGVLTPPNPYSTITIDPAGVVTLGKEPLFWGVMSPDKKIIVGASTSDPYSLHIYQMRGQAYTQPDLSGTSIAFTFQAASTSSWNYATWSTNITGGVTGSNWLGSGTGTTPLLSSWQLNIDSPGEVTTSGDFVSNGGWMSFGKELVVISGGDAPGDSFMTLMVQ